MSHYTLVCDRENGLSRTALYKGREFFGLFVDSLESPDLSGARARGKIVRVAKGHKVAWVDAGLQEKLYCESSAPLSDGQFVTLEIISTMGEGKAWPARIIDGVLSDKIGLLSKPPQTWQRALGALPEEAEGECQFQEKEDYDLFLKDKSRPQIKGELFSDPVQPDLSDKIDDLLASRVKMSGGADIIIESTKALVAVDVNSGEGGDPLSVNLRAMQEVARQIRLRNLSGIIVIDALKMKNRADKSKLLHALTRACEKDFVSCHVFGISKLGLIELTREKHGPALHEIIKE